MSARIKIGIVGVGRMGTLHLSKFLGMSAVEVVGIAELTPDRAKEISIKHNVKVFESLEEMLFEVDAIIIASPTPTHYMVGRKALESGVHVLIEKPMCETESEAIELYRLASQNKLVCQVGFLERFRLLSFQKQVHLGPVRFIEAHRLAPTVGREIAVDVVSDLMIHDVDLALSLIGEEPHSISAIGVPVITPHFDVANVRLEFPGGAIANLTASRISVSAQRKFRVFSLQQYCAMDFLNNSIDSYSCSSQGAIKHENIKPQSVDALYDQCHAFVKAIRHEQLPVVSAYDGAIALKVTKLIREKIVERAAWKVSSFHKDFHADFVSQAVQLPEGI